MICPGCQRDLQIGDFPFCRGQQSDHERTGSREAGQFQPIYLDQAVDDPSRFSFPGASDDAVPEGYRRIAITNLREADHWTSQVNGIHHAETELQRETERRYSEQATTERRERIDAEMRRRGLDGSGRARFLRDAARQLADRRREAFYAKRKATEFSIQVISRDSSNREPHADIRTGWKDRRV